MAVVDIIAITIGLTIAGGFAAMVLGVAVYIWKQVINER